MEKTRPINKTIAGVSSVLFVASLCLLSCDGGNKRKNAFVAGIFEGVIEEDESISTHLVVTEIDENDYSSANGMNVVQDLWNLKYYSLEFHAIDDGGIRTNYDFVNLRDIHPKVKAQPIYYTGDGCLDIIPWGLYDGELASKSYNYYGVGIFKMNEERRKRILHTLLYIKGG